MSVADHQTVNSYNVNYAASYLTARVVFLVQSLQPPKTDIFFLGIIVTTMIGPKQFQKDITLTTKILV